MCIYLLSSSNMEARGGTVGSSPALQTIKAAGSIPDGIVGIFHWHNHSGRTMSWDRFNLLTFPGWNGGRCIGPYRLHVPIVLILGVSTSWNPHGPYRDCLTYFFLPPPPNDILHLIRLSWSNTVSCERLSRVFCSPQKCVTVYTDSGIYFVIRCVVVERGRTSTTAPAQFEYGARDSTQPSARQPTGNQRAPSTTRSH